MSGIKSRGWARACLTAVGALVLSAGVAGAQTTLKIASGVVGDNPRNQAAEEFGRVVAEASKGKYKGEYFFNNVLARGEAAHLEGVQLGTIDITMVGSAPIGGIFEPAFLPLDLPFLFTNQQHAWKVVDGPLGQELLKKLEAKNLRGFCFGGGWGFRNMLSNKRPIVHPDDMKGLTIRVQESPAYVAMMKALGANPVPMPWGEVYLAMKQGTVDGMELPVFVVVSDKFYEVTKYYSLTQHTYPPVVWFANLRKYNALSADDKKAWDTAAAAACKKDRDAEMEKGKLDLEIVKKAGVQVNEVASIDAFRQKMAPAYEAVSAKVGKEWMDKVLAAVKAAGTS
jgi:tripartite ATP-independent transporter DctP family solute receptor